MRTGFDGFSDHEIVELMLTLSIPRKDVKNLAKALLKTFGSLSGICDADPGALKQISGIGDVTVFVLCVVRAVHIIHSLQEFDYSPALNSTGKVVEFCRNTIADTKTDVLHLLCMDASLRLVENGLGSIKLGAIATVEMLSKEVARIAIGCHATSVIFVHKSPNPDPKPPCQCVYGKKIKSTLKCLEINVLDIIVLGKNSSFSFTEHGLL
jgi:DNA repair protein RadC